ncbi:unnamed protein product [Brachionus calyciflorus]|uniref:ISXO2-like transposase domain-containing protein n=1 Tax=Brachionus calyciflorus TaxID=104777 RepID=A0A813PJ02_9BILA|nr:unnamed protein product [Brachionus calyciflorus]
MFGLVERGENGKAYVEVVKDRKGPTLLKILYDHVEEGTVIISDTWSSYNRISKLKNFKHLSGSGTKPTKKFKEMNGCSRVHFKSYLDEFIWRTNNTGEDKDELDGTWSLRPKIINTHAQKDQFKSSYEKIMESKIKSLDEKLSQLTIEKNPVKKMPL